MDGKRDGYGVWKGPDGDMYEGEFRNDLVYGDGTYTDADGNVED